MKCLAALCVFVLVAHTAAAQKTIVQTAQATPELSTLVTVLTTPGYGKVLDALSGPGNFTVFAPNNNAFAMAGVDPSHVGFVTNVLYYHVLGERVNSGDLAPLQFPNTLLTNASYVNLGGKGQVLGVSKSSAGVTINFGLGMKGTAKVVVADVQCSNGVVHIIDTVMIPPANAATTAKAGGLTDLVMAVVKAQLADAVDKTPSLTIFAPTNAAFQAVNWEKLPVDTLTTVLKYHVVPAVAYSTDLTDGEQVPTLEGGKLTLHLDAAGVMVNDAKVVDANILDYNGVVHVIDKVLLPPSLMWLSRV